MKRIFGILFGVAWLVFIVLVAIGKIPYLSQFLCIDGKPELLRGIGLFLLGIGVAPLGLLLAYDRTESLKVQTDTEKEKAITESFAKSVELLGNKRETARQGGIHALGRLAKDNDDLHPMIMNIVASYIRQESRTWFNKRKKPKDEVNGEYLKDEDLIEILKLEPMPMDIEAAIAVIRERNVDYDKEPKAEEYTLDLTNAYIFNANFSNTTLRQVNFTDSKIINCNFDNTDLRGSNFYAADRSGTILDAEQLGSVYFGDSTPGKPSSAE